MSHRQTNSMRHTTKMSHRKTNPMRHTTRQKCRTEKRTQCDTNYKIFIRKSIDFKKKLWYKI